MPCHLGSEADVHPSFRRPRAFSHRRRRTRPKPITLVRHSVTLQRKKFNAPTSGDDPCPTDGLDGPNGISVERPVFVGSPKRATGRSAGCLVLGATSMIYRAPGGRIAKGLRTRLTVLIVDATERVQAEQRALATSGAVHIRLLAKLAYFHDKPSPNWRLPTLGQRGKIRPARCHVSR